MPYFYNAPYSLLSTDQIESFWARNARGARLSIMLGHTGDWDHPLSITPETDLPASFMVAIINPCANDDFVPAPSYQINLLTDENPSGVGSIGWDAAMFLLQTDTGWFLNFCCGDENKDILHQLVHEMMEDEEGMQEGREVTTELPFAGGATND